MDSAVPASWRSALDPVLAHPQFQTLAAWLLAEEEAGKAIYPPRGQWLRALELTPRDRVKVVILGQDPYHGPGQAHGLAFSVPAGLRVPPSLANLYKELRTDLGREPPAHGNLEHWAEQGVLLLNACLTVEAGRAASHSGKGWEALTDAVIAAVARGVKPSVFMLWGNHARAKAPMIAKLDPGSRQLVLAAPHPSPLSAYTGFFGSRPFSQANAFLAAHGRDPIAW